MRPTSYIQHPMYMTPLTLTQGRNMTLDYEFTVLVKLKYAFISLLAIKLFQWGVKSFSQSTNIMQTSYNVLRI